MKNQPPKWIDLLLQWFCADYYLEEIQGDLHEWFYRRARRSGFKKARLFYLYDVITYFRLFRVKKLNDMENNNNLLFINYVKMTFRQYKRNFGYASLNTLGLTIGLLSVMFIAVFILHELSYDRFHKDYQKIYRLVNHMPESGRMADSTPSPWKKQMEDVFPEIESHTRLGQDIILVNEGEAGFLENGFYWADPNFMEFFSFEVLTGDRVTMLAEPNTIVLTESKAMRYFNSVDVLGKTLPIKVYDGNKEFLMKVSGVIADVPSNSHLQFDFLGSMSTTDEMYGRFEQFWGLNWLQSYVKLSQNVSLEQLSDRVPQFFEQKHREGSSQTNGLLFQPLSKVRLYSNKVEGRLAKGNLNYILLFGFVALLVLLAASINYVNLTTATSTRRGKEVGMRKVFGAVRSQVARQFYVECALQLSLAFVLAISFALILLPSFDAIVDKQLEISALFQWQVMAVMAVVFLFILLLSGLYPSVVMNKFKPIDVLRGNLLSAVGKRSGVRKIQVLIQFAIATFLISSTAIVVKQMQFFRDFDMGFEASQLISIPVDDRGLQMELGLIKNRMRAIPGVTNITASGEALPSAMNSTWSLQWPGKSDDGIVGINVVAIDYDYFETLDTRILSGRNISKDNRSDSTVVCLLNESAFALTGFQELDGQRVKLDDTERTVIGVVEDFHYNSLHSEVAPCVYMLFPPGFRASPDNLIVRLEETNLSAALNQLDNVWKEFSNQPFDFDFVDQEFAQLYGDEQKFMTVILIFAAIGVFLAVLGLVSLVAFVAERKSKELSIRKVLGASRLQVLSKITGQFGLIFLLSVLIALPLSRLTMERWLSGFANRVEVNWQIFAVSAVIALGVTLLSIGVQAIKVASSNPTRYLSDNQ